MTSAAPAASKASLDCGGAEKSKVAGNKDAAAANAKAKQADAAVAAAVAAANGGVDSGSSPHARPLRRLREGEAFILDINGGDRQCLMYAKANR